MPEGGKLSTLVDAVTDSDVAVELIEVLEVGQIFHGRIGMVIMFVGVGLAAIRMKA